MLIIPVSRQPNWRRPPLVTLLLILVNCLVFFGLQSGDERRQEKAYRYYAASTLPATELPRYVQDLERTGRGKEAAPLARALANGEWPVVLTAMESDRAFLRRLRSSQAIQAGDAEHGAWQRQRNEFERLRGATMLARFGFRPADPTLAGFFGHMFLHASFDHLLGNMAILFIVGYMVEEALGKRRYLAFYLLAGLGAGALDFAVNSGRTVPGIGASGAISGVMAMFVVLYGMRRIRFFYWVLFYFDFFRAPAIIMLPLWIGNELYQHFFSHGSPVNYIAHLGGFLSGAALIAAQRRFGRAPAAMPAPEAAIDPLPGQLAHVDALLRALRIDEARGALRRLAKAHPQDIPLLVRYYKIAHTAPASAELHHAAALIFALPETAPGSSALIHETFQDYLQCARPSVRLSADQLAALIRRLARGGHTGDAERLTRALARRAPEHPQLPGLLLLVAESFRRAGDEARLRETLERLRADFPESDAARAAPSLSA